MVLEFEDSLLCIFIFNFSFYLHLDNPSTFSTLFKVLWILFKFARLHRMKESMIVLITYINKTRFSIIYTITILIIIFPNYG